MANDIHHDVAPAYPHIILDLHFEQEKYNLQAASQAVKLVFELTT